MNKNKASEIMFPVEKQTAAALPSASEAKTFSNLNTYTASDKGRQAQLSPEPVDELYLTDFPDTPAWQIWAFECIEDADPLYSADFGYLPILRYPKTWDAFPPASENLQRTLDNFPPEFADKTVLEHAPALELVTEELLQEMINFTLLAADFCADIGDYDAAASITVALGLHELAEDYTLMKMDAGRTADTLSHNVRRYSETNVKQAIQIPEYNIPRRHGLDVDETLRHNYQMYRIFANFQRDMYNETKDK